MARRSAKRYAQAIFEIAMERGALDQWQSDLSKIARLGEYVTFIAVLESPKLRLSDKAKLLSQYLGEANPLAVNLVCLLVARGRLSMIAGVADEYQQLLDSHRGIERAEVITAIPLEDGDKQRLTERLETIVGKKVAVQPEVDPSLVGGVVARIGGKLLDGSTRSRLEALKKELSGAGR